MVSRSDTGAACSGGGGRDGVGSGVFEAAGFAGAAAVTDCSANAPSAGGAAPPRISIETISGSSNVIGFPDESESVIDFPRRIFFTVPRITPPSFRCTTARTFSAADDFAGSAGVPASEDSSASAAAATARAARQRRKAMKTPDPAIPLLNLDFNPLFPRYADATVERVGLIVCVGDDLHRRILTCAGPRLQRGVRVDTGRVIDLQRRRGRRVEAAARQRGDDSLPHVDTLPELH